MTTNQDARQTLAVHALLRFDTRAGRLLLLPLAIGYGLVVGPLRVWQGLNAGVLAVVLAALAGALFGQRAGVLLAVVLGMASVGLDWWLGASNQALLEAGGTVLMAMLLGWGAGLRHAWARRAQAQLVETIHRRETLEVQVAELLNGEQRLLVRNEQHAAVATLSQRALVAADLQSLFEDVVRQVGDVLGVDSCTLWTSGADAELRLVAAHAGLFGSTDVQAELERHARYALWVGEAVVVTDLAADQRLRGGPADPSLRSGVMLPIQARGAPHAVIGAHARSERVFGSDDVSFMQVIANLVSSAITAKLVEEGFERQAMHDPLTGLANRSLFQDRLAQALHAASRDNRPVALMLMDLNRFKEVNDTLGHQAGDQLLLEVSRRLLQAKRAADTVARLGGDEFALILPAVGDAEAAVRLGTKLLDVVQRPMPLDGQLVDIGASIGIGVYPEHGEDPDELLRRADVAMYFAKQKGSGVAIYEAEHDQNSRSRLALTSSLRQAIESNALVLHFQPLIDVRTAGVASMEALLRWQHPELGLLGPDAFVPLAQQMGLIGSLDRWALGAALRQAAAWRAAGFDLPVSVNLSMRSVLDARLTQVISELLANLDLPPRLLQLEITESSIMADPPRMREVLAQCQALGVRIAIDDFGTGYSSLAYLKRLPVESLKIDKSFISDMAHDKSDLAIVRSTLELGHNLGLHLIAEGVEDEITWRLLSQLKCDLAQGHYFSPPQPAAEMLVWLQHSAWAKPAALPDAA